MNRIAEFEKVSKDQFVKDYVDCFNVSEEEAVSVYEAIKLPRRATKGSAGYDFYTTADIKLAPGETVKIPTGIRSKIEEGWVLMLFPRSGLGFKYRMQLNNTVGVIDSDYYNSDNEGHIFVKITNDSNENKTIELSKGAGFCQGLFMPFGITNDDDVCDERNGGFGSTDKG